MDGIKWFARFLLEGQVFPKLKKYNRKNGDNQRVLLTSPSSMTKSWAKLLPRVQYITNSLMSKGIMSRDKLKEEWCKDPTFLLSDYQKWLPESCHSEVEIMWPPV
ncbi:putative ATP-dependent RNA helicase rha-2 [Trichogramma pretiosum]|uniref:putative ATP-dependent RNA helicase rha-2 n=1 Tax=Trichogramma pretiosum TaxID=7493 RepID=UPI000C71A91E|nr:putative ATP-dependent RNA helicase rha-2 [Trichogramma pretiosum]